MVVITNPRTTPAIGDQARIPPEIFPKVTWLKPIISTITENGIDRTNNKTPITSKGIPNFTLYLLITRVYSIAVRIGKSHIHRRES